MILLNSILDIEKVSIEVPKVLEVKSFLTAEALSPQSERSLF